MNASLIFDIDQIDDVAKTLQNKLYNYPLITLSGPLGAGKTTLTKALLRAYGVVDVITSPTFTYVNIYYDQNGIKIYHFDLYRIKNSQDFLALGFDEYLYDEQAKIFIEWAEHIEDILPSNKCRLELSYYNPTKRLLTYSCVAKR